MRRCSREKRLHTLIALKRMLLILIGAVSIALIIRMPTERLAYDLAIVVIGFMIIDNIWQAAGLSEPEE